jgi:hypothetical protein
MTHISVTGTAAVAWSFRSELHKCHPRVTDIVTSSKAPHLDQGHHRKDNNNRITSYPSLAAHVATPPHVASPSGAAGQASMPMHSSGNVQSHNPKKGRNQSEEKEQKHSSSTTVQAFLLLEHTLTCLF